MSKELPYYQFEVAEYLAGDIMICSLEAQGLFSIIKCLYWQKECKLTVKQVLKRYDKQKLIDELIEEGCLKVENGNITINFLLIQYQTFKDRRDKLSAAGRKGGLHKKEATLKPPLSEDEATPKHIEESRVEDSREEENIVDDSESKSAHDFLINNCQIKLEAICMKYISEIPDWDEMVDIFNLKADKEELEYKPRVLLSRFELLCKNWIKFNKKNNGQNGTKQNRRERFIGSYKG